MIYPSLKSAMGRGGINQKTIAGTLGVRESTVSDWFSGRHIMALDRAFEIRDKLFPELSIDELFAKTTD